MRALALVTLVLLAGCGGSSRDARPSIVVIVLDTLRADRLLCYGAERDLAPFLNGFADESVVFDSAWSTAPWTPPATASLFTSRHPIQHGVITGKLRNKDGDLDEPMRLNRITKELVTLPELLQGEGYRTFGIADNPNIVEEMGFADGFERFVSFPNLGAPEVNRVLSEWRDEIVGSDEPYLLYLHYMDPHAPYEPHAEWFRPDRDAMGAAIETGEPPNPINQLREGLRHLARKSLDLPHGAPLPADVEGQELEWIVGAYDSEVAWLDKHVREAFELLGIDGEVAVFVTSDHGEEFGDHGYLGHGQSTYSELVRVPFLMRLPGLPPAKVSAPVSHLDLVPTVRALLGLPASGADQGASLATLAREGPADDRLLHFSRDTEERVNDEYGVLAGRHKLRVLDRTGAVELYDLEADPLERTDLAAELPGVVTSLRGKIEHLRTSLDRLPRSYSAPRARTEEEEALLDSLGYTGD